MTLSWTAPPGAVAYIIEAGSSTGLANLANFSTGSAATTLSAPGVAAGTYFVRVRALDASQTAGPASNEIVLVVGTVSSCAQPAAPTGLFLSTNSAGTVGLQWSGVAGATSYLLEAGTASGLSNLVNLNVATTSFSASNVGAGTYFVRVRARTLCPIGRGASTLSAPSNEVTIVVTGSSSPPPPPPPPER